MHYIISPSECPKCGGALSDHGHDLKCDECGHIVPEDEIDIEGPLTAPDAWAGGFAENC